MLDKKEEKKVERLVEDHLDRMDKVSLSVLAECLGAGMQYYDPYYTISRLKQVVEESFKDIDWKNDELEGKKKEFFNRKAKEIMENAKIGIFERDSRESKCEPSVHKILALVLDKDFLESDSKWLDSYIRAHNEAFMRDLANHYIQALGNKIEFSLEKSFQLAQEKMMGVPRVKLTLKELDMMLKK